MRNILAAIITAFLATAPNIATAGLILNGSFESGDVSGFIPVNTVDVVSGTLTHDGDVVSPTDGQFMALLTSGSSDTTQITRDENGNNPTGDPVLSGLITYLQLAPGQTFTFDWFFIGNDDSHFNDFAGFVTESGDNILLPQIMDVGDFGSSGWNTFEFSPVGGFNGLVGWYVTNQGDDLFSSQLALDNLLTVPEPASLALVSLGLLGMGAFRRRS